MPDLTIATQRAEVDAPLIAWFAIHGALILALRHPGLTGAPDVTKALDQIIAQLEDLLRESGFLTEAELIELHEGDAAAVPE